MSEVPAGYKRTEVGVIPEDWDSVQLREHVVKVGSGITPTGGIKVYQEYGRPFVRSQNVGWGTLDLTDLAFISDEIHQTFAGTELKAGDVLLNITGASIGRVALADSTVSGGNVNQHVCIIRTVERTLNPSFLRHLLLSEVGQRQVDSFQAGGNRQGLNFGQVRSFLLPLPSAASEQRAIADALQDTDALIAALDALIAALDALIAKKRDIKQGAMQELLGGEHRLPGYEGDWEPWSLSSACTKIQDGTHFSPKTGGGDFLYITSKNVRAGALDLEGAETVSSEEHAKIYARCDTRAGDLFLTKDGASTGNAAINDIAEPVSLLSSVAFLRFSPRHCARFFLYQILAEGGQRQIKEQMSGNAITRLTLAKIRQLRFLAPSFEEQQAVACVLSDIDTEIAGIEAKLRKAITLKQGMMQVLLTGEVRLA